MSIHIRSLEPTDAIAMQALYADEIVYANTLQMPDPSAAMWQQRLAEMPKHVYAYVAVIDDTIVGNVGFEVMANPRRRHVGSFGMGVLSSHQGRGVGSALLAKVIDLADNWLNLQRIEITVYTDNVAAFELYKKFGFTCEGESQAYAFRDGEYVDVYHMARIRSQHTIETKNTQ